MLFLHHSPFHPIFPMAAPSTLTDLSAITDAVCGVWPSLTAQERQELTSHLSVLRYKRNDVIYGVKDNPDKMYFLVHGKVKVAKNGVGGRDQIVRVIKPVEMFGYRAWFAGASHLTTATVLEPSVVASAPMALVERLMTGNALMGLQVVRHLSVLLGQSDERTVNLTQKHIRGRLAEALLFLKDNHGVEEDGCTLGIYLSREDLANLSNMTTSNAIRTLSTFADEQLVAIDGKKIKIVREEELRRISQMG